MVLSLLLLLFLPFGDCQTPSCPSPINIDFHDIQRKTTEFSLLLISVLPDIPDSLPPCVFLDFNLEQMPTADRQMGWQKDSLRLTAMANEQDRKETKRTIHNPQIDNNKLWLFP